MSFCELQIKRLKYDVFQNTSCRAISESKLTCNSNYSPMFSGPLVMYSTKYTLKGTQEDEQEEYSRAQEAAQRVLERWSNQRRNQTDMTEDDARLTRMRRLLLTASHAHLKCNVVGAAQASFLTRNGTRFLLSHEFVWCPIRDIEKLLNLEPVSAVLQNCGTRRYFENSALHYLCRPPTLGNLSVFDFYRKYEVKQFKRSFENKPGVYPFVLLNSSNVQHPSLGSEARENMRSLQCIVKRERPRLLRLIQQDFPDTARFGGNIFDPGTKIKPEAETYAKLLLILFMPLRQSTQLTIDSSSVKLLRSISHTILTPERTRFLQNLQDTRANCLRHGGSGDCLERETIPFTADENGSTDITEDNDENCDGFAELFSSIELDDLINIYGHSSTVCDTKRITFNDDNCKDILSDAQGDLDFRNIRNKGTYDAGYESIARMPTGSNDECGNFIECQQSRNIETDQSIVANHDTDTLDADSSVVSKEQIVYLFQKTSTRSRFSAITKQEVQAKEANGTVRSITSWSTAHSLDNDQRRAFEIVTASVILTYYKDAEEEFPDGVRGGEFTKERKRLELLAGIPRRKSRQLITLIQGPAGSGKTTVLDLILEYCREYCSLIEQPFTSQTIVVTALTGVAATLLLGDTTSRSCYLNCKEKTISCIEFIERWKDTRLLLIDEVSFMSKDQVEKLHRNLCILKDRFGAKFGGLHVVFSGDFQQLEPVQQAPLYETYCAYFEDSINVFIELNGSYRFSEDPEWGGINARFSVGEPTVNDIMMINKTCLVKGGTVLPEGIQYATYTNKDRDSINTAVFEKHCEKLSSFNGSNIATGAIIILCNNIMIRNGSSQHVKFPDASVIWEHVGEDDASRLKRQDRVDPALKLFYGAPVMIPTNEHGVAKGLANGTRAKVLRVCLKPGQQTRFARLSSGILVPCVLASQVDHVTLQHCNKRIFPSEFTMKPKQFNNQSVSIPLPRDMMADPVKDRRTVRLTFNQLPIISNSATTGHKLQGTGVDHIFIHNWHYAKNWPYVLMSRVKTMSGLFLRRPLDRNLSKYKKSPALQRFFDKLRSRCSQRHFSADEYDAMATAIPSTEIIRTLS